MQVEIEVLKAHSKGGRPRKVGETYMTHIKKARLLERIGKVKILGKVKESVEKPKSTSKPDVDLKGVPFNPDIHQRSDEPFYKIGSRVGQFRKKPGISDEEYDGYYAAVIKPTDGDFHTTALKNE